MTALAIAGAVFGYTAIGGVVGGIILHALQGCEDPGFPAAIGGTLWPFTLALCLVSLPVYFGSWIGNGICDRLNRRHAASVAAERKRAELNAEVERELCLLDGGRP